MKKSTLLKYVAGDLSPDERRAVHEWAEKSELNMKYLSRLKNLYVMDTMPDEFMSAESSDAMLSFVKNASSKGTYVIRKSTFWSSAAIIFICFTTLWSLSHIPMILSDDVEGLISYNDIDSKKVLYTDMGVKARIMLPDSSEVWLNSGTKIVYPEHFGTSEREVFVSGEAYFKVKTNPECPMIVRTGKDFAVKVLGTEFNLKAYDDDINSVATLYKGEIKIIDGNDERHVVAEMNPRQSITIGNNMSMNKIDDPKPENKSAWKEGRIIFDSTPVSDVVKTLQRWHGVKIVVLDNSVLKTNITATFESESIVQILDLIKLTSFIDYKVKDDVYYLTRR